MNPYIPRDEGQLSREIIDNVEAHALGISYVKKAGFRLANVSMRSESCYYEHPARPGLLLRVSMHRGKARIGHNNVLAKISFSSRIPQWSEFAVYCAVRMAIGNYFLRDIKPSEYMGKRGTWEQSVRDKDVGIEPALKRALDFLLP